MSKILGSRIKLFRTKENMTREELSNLLKISIHTLIKYEQGQREPNIETLSKISQILNVSPKTLLADEIFENEILNKAITLIIPTLPKDADDVFAYLEEYTHDYDSLYNLHNKVTNFLPLDCTKGLLTFILQISQEDFSDIYKYLISTGIYNLDPELENYCQDLYISIMNPVECLSDEDVEFLKSLGYIKNGHLIPSIKLNKENGHIKSIKDGNNTIFLPIPFKEMKAKVDSVYPALDAEIKFLSDPNVEMVFNYSFDELARQGGYQELLILAVEKAIKETLKDIKNHIEAGDLFDGVSSWITKESPLYEILKSKKEENK